MDWRKLIHPNPKTSTIQPPAPETRLSVEFLLGLFAAGWTEEQVLEKYPTLTSPKLRAALAAADSQLGTRGQIKYQSKWDNRDIPFW
ncbi:MAG: DUF433 domain-containing protein [Microcoleus sp. PH2017_25_DOB_D_A]|uniref:DUF433 domain-containing protein n=1 Tax=unclassified Microcoleus TaxID=2642155 RepID=UPI001DB7C5E4|nr:MULTISPECIES: DUF433 domain-containing protein [unclassified Microcoleus]MCC3538429.1 DUF433 domain-containing protein [Microcoleus sp. PH2017_25_DOB_D_A]MCC3551038.1 DUF433 domain-containing protein [Microcoleus sp. PH2017_24_DOB_U_A]TAE36662.1 MAG: DUF433 domain-containing protein [Oscillatoriales cyanobacterium]